MRTWIFILLGLGAAVAGGAFLANRPTVVTVSTPSRGDIAHIVYASGTVEAETSADVTSIVAQRITAHCNCEGETVSAGDIIVELDNSEVRARLRELEARVGLLNQQVERAMNLLERGVGSRQDFDRVSSELAGAEAAVAAQREVLARYKITAPIAGQILRLDADVGEVAQPGTVLFTVGQPQPLEVIADINEEDIPLIARGQRALLGTDAFPDEVLEATLAHITPRGDSTLKTYRVRLALPEETPLFIGMSVDVNIIIENRQDRVLVPSTALTGDNQAFIVREGFAEPVQLDVGLRGITSVEVLSGLEEGDSLVDPIPDGLIERQRVRISGNADAP